MYSDNDCYDRMQRDEMSEFDEISLERQREYSEQLNTGIEKMRVFLEQQREIAALKKQRDAEQQKQLNDFCDYHGY